MILPFSTKINGKPNYFIEKIWRGFLHSRISSYCMYNIYNKCYSDAFGEIWDDKIDLLPKIHTIRLDNSNRWKEGNKIHFVINNRTAKRFQFAPVLDCVRIQKIEIIHKNKPIVKIDGRELNIYELQRLSSNDCFESVEDFFNYFKEDFKGKIIHWTNIKY
ncbi:hypothetical protein ETU09_05865 [Apibacter muscae]|uniref:Uncharacterized protein n=1 Tax=Apibacter muscae TaxID=2509004 RepID=A0A563DEF7_9FLAO|nr:hypothetical protein [Apibacter muscae]TWP28449.1 hypothetical protein ETU09_05865 [Apibacter muscae]